MNLSSLDSQRLMLSWPGVLVFALATWGILAKPSRLDSRRPVESRPTSASASKSGEIPSRLWDSPFTSLPPVDEGSKSNNGSPSVSFSNQLKARLQQLNATSYRRFTVATVCMPSPHSSEDLEQARRRRWAVVSALHASGAIPLHPDRIELAEFTANARDESDRVTSRKFTVPLEWFAVPGSASTADPAVCEQLIAVVWLDEAQLGERPLDELSLLLEAIADETSAATGVKGSPPVFALLGPLTSNMLASFAEQWNHNLVIVSHFDSQLNSRLQNSVAPFRDSYQTSLFLGVRLAVDSEAPTLLDLRTAATQSAKTPNSIVHELFDRDSSTASPPRLRSLPALTFEVSNQGAYRLGWQSDPIHPEKRSENLLAGWRRTTLATAAGLLCLLFVAPLSGVIRDLLCWPWRRFHFRYHHGLVLFAVFAAIPLTLVVYHAHYSETGEPFAAFAGISIWPTVYLRLFLLCVCIYFLLSQQEEHDELTRRISRDCFASADQPRANYLKPLAISTLLSNAILSWRDPNRSPPASASRTASSGHGDDALASEGVRLWHEYLDRSTWRARHARLLPHLATALLIGITLFAIHGLAQPPIRDDSSRYASITSYFVSGVASLWLLLVVLDCVRLCKRWIELLAVEKAPLPAEAIAQAALQRHWSTGEFEGANYRSEWLVSFQRFRAATTLANAIVRMTYAPFVVIAISFIARHNIFDNWEWNTPMVVMYAFAVGIAIYAVFTFGGVVRSYKERILDELRSAKGASQLTAEDVKNLDGLVKEVEDTSGSALAPVQKNPIVAVALMPAGSVGVLSLIEQLAPVFIH